MDIQILIGMPLGYAKSVLEKEHISYEIERTESRSRFFECDDEALYVIRAIQEDGYVRLLINSSLKKSESVSAIVKGDTLHV